MLKQIIAIALVITAAYGLGGQGGSGEACATFEQLTESNGEEFEIKYSMENEELNSADGENLGFEREQKNGKDLDYAVLGWGYSQNVFKVKGDKNKEGFRIWSADDRQIFSYNQGISNLFKGGYYMWTVPSVEKTNDSHNLDYYTRFSYDDEKQSLSAKLSSGNEYALAVTENKHKGTQIYQKRMYNFTKNTQFCFIRKMVEGSGRKAKKKYDTNYHRTDNQQQTKFDPTKKTGEGDGNQQQTEIDPAKKTAEGNDNNDNKQEELKVNIDSSAASGGVLVALITLSFVN